MFNAKCFTVMIISTGNMKEERKIIRDAVYHWNEINSENEGIILKPSGYDIDVRADSGKRPQASINEQIVVKSDFAIAVFWNRLGKNTGEYQSGLVEEIELHLKARKKVLTYFSKIKVDIDDIDVEQLQKLRDYKENLKKRVNYKEFENYDRLKLIILDDLTRLIRELNNEGNPSGGDGEEGNTSSRKDDINYTLQRAFFYGSVPEINLAYEQQIPRFKGVLNADTKGIIINDILLKLQYANGDFDKIVTPMKRLFEYYDFIQDNQLEILGFVLDELMNKCTGGYYSFAAETYTRQIFNRITKEQYKIIRKMYMYKMLGNYLYIYDDNPIVEKFLEYTSVESENNGDEKELRNIIFKQKELWNKKPLTDAEYRDFDKNKEKLKEIRNRL